MADAPVFVDTGYFVALLNRQDTLHARALELSRGWERRARKLLTTDAVLVELANFFARSPLRSLAISSVETLRSAPGWQVEHVTPQRFNRGIARYAAQPDKGWSLTDCLSMDAMADHCSTEVATPDHHFAQAGFRVLMRHDA
ncbi:MAG TPA: PIN domain-containing protein [Polyangia bacterium]|nr:PIN domain-containing protein [Polyangia bacterium]